MAKAKQIKWQYIVEDGGEMSKEDFDVLVSLPAQIIIARMKRKVEPMQITPPLR
jgi:hypothetical protein